MNRFAVGASLAAAVLAGTVIAADPIKSGPQTGANLSPFHPLNVTGSQAGKKHCLV